MTLFIRVQKKPALAAGAGIVCSRHNALAVVLVAFTMLAGTVAGMLVIVAVVIPVLGLLCFFSVNDPMFACCAFMFRALDHTTQRSARCKSSRCSLQHRKKMGPGRPHFYL